HLPLGYLGDPERTRETFPVIDGVRYCLDGDRARHADGGRLVFLGRESMCINTGGEKVYVEEVERVVKSHPAVYDALVVGTPRPRAEDPMPDCYPQLTDTQRTVRDTIRRIVETELKPHVEAMEHGDVLPY